MRNKKSKKIKNKNLLILKAPVSPEEFFDNARQKIKTLSERKISTSSLTISFGEIEDMRAFLSSDKHPYTLNCQGILDG